MGPEPELRAVVVVNAEFAGDYSVKVVGVAAGPLSGDSIVWNPDSLSRRALRNAQFDDEGLVSFSVEAGLFRDLTTEVGVPRSLLVDMEMGRAMLLRLRDGIERTIEGLSADPRSRVGENVSVILLTTAEAREDIVPAIQQGIGEIAHSARTIDRCPLHNLPFVCSECSRGS
jgi:hypothetical protein